MVLLLVFPQMWRFPYPFGFCNPWRIYGRKINGMIWYDMQIYKMATPWHTLYVFRYTKWQHSDIHCMYSDIQNGNTLTYTVCIQIYKMATLWHTLYVFRYTKCVKKHTFPMLPPNAQFPILLGMRFGMLLIIKWIFICSRSHANIVFHLYVRWLSIEEALREKTCIMFSHLLCVGYSTVEHGYNVMVGAAPHLYDCAN
jgi:hypothetical protein